MDHMVVPCIDKACLGAVLVSSTRDGLGRDAEVGVEVEVGMEVEVGVDDGL